MTERERFQNKIQGLHNYYQATIDEVKLSFAQQIEDLQESFALSANILNQKDMKLKI